MVFLSFYESHTKEEQNILIDIHSHLLPFMDDGAEDWDQALAMARQACADGIEVIIATPHHENGRYVNEAAHVIQSVEILNSKLQDMGLDVVVLPGQEIRVHDDLLTHWDAGELMALNNTRYMLLEFPSSNVPKQIEDLIHELSLLDIQVIIAHPERNAEIARNPERLKRLVELGALSQLTAQSITGENGRKLQKLSFNLCKMNLIHFLATDAHDPIRRPFRLTRSYQLIEQQIGSGMALYFKENAQRLLNNMVIPGFDNTDIGVSERKSLLKVLTGAFGGSR